MEKVKNKRTYYITIELPLTLHPNLSIFNNIGMIVFREYLKQTGLPIYIYVFEDRYTALYVGVYDFNSLLLLDAVHNEKQTLTRSERACF